MTEHHKKRSQGRYHLRRTQHTKSTLGTDSWCSDPALQPWNTNNCRTVSISVENRAETSCIIGNLPNHADDKTAAWYFMSCTSHGRSGEGRIRVMLFVANSFQGAGTNAPTLHLGGSSASHKSKRTRRSVNVIRFSLSRFPVPFLSELMRTFLSGGLFL